MNRRIINRVTKPVPDVDPESIIDQLNNITLPLEVKKGIDSLVRNNGSSLIGKYMGGRQINLLEYIKLYKIGQVPFIYFFIVYLCLYIINDCFFTGSSKIVLLLSFPMTICYALLLDKKCKLSWHMMIGVIGICCLILIKH